MVDLGHFVKRHVEFINNIKSFLRVLVDENVVPLLRHVLFLVSGVNWQVLPEILDEACLPRKVVLCSARKTTILVRTCRS